MHAHMHIYDISKSQAIKLIHSQHFSFDAFLQNIVFACWSQAIMKLYCII